MSRFVNPRPQYLDDAGNPLIEGKVYIYESGTDDLKDLFFDVNLSQPAPNPVILSGSGRMPNTFFTGSARGKLTDSDEVQFWDIDPIGSDTGDGAFSSWNSITIYNVSDIVIGSDGLFYISITNGNQDSDPVSTPVDWTQIRFTRVWNPNETYSIDQIAEGSDGQLYTSRTNSNLNNDPISDTINWNPAVETSANVFDDASWWLYA